MQKSRCVDGPFHRGDVRLRIDVGDEGRRRGPGSEDVPIDDDMVNVEQLEGRAGGLVEEDHEKGDEREPEFGAAKLAGAAAADLDEERPPRDKQEDQGQHERQEGRSEVEEVAAVNPIVSGGVHANLKEKKKEEN